MRKNQHKRLLEMLKTLDEAGSLGMLGECQSFAVAMGETIEGIAGEGTRAVAALEEYCELLYTAHLGAVSGKISASAAKALKKQLNKIEKALHAELAPDRIEIVFFPYKASMWDSFESVWKEAAQDPACDAYVVPIPYFTQGKDGKAEVHYEAADYPKYVPLTDWRSYDVKARHPDIIFTHNPYDEYNTTTRLPEEYYCRTLREHTDMLAYIPYFVAFPTVSAERAPLPGTIYAKRVFVQSEQDRSVYISEVKKWLKENGYVVNAPEIEKRFVVLGSPKLDKLLTAKPRDFELPRAWKALLHGPDSTRKKIVLYNSTIAAFLANTMNYIKKLRYVFEIFRARKDVLLWWRPHPLLRATVDAMRPEYAHEYAGLVEEYQREGFGVYDDSPDPHMAIALSDAYYGDSGSLAVMYQLTAKPMLWQSADNVGRYPAIGAVCEASGALWAVDVEINALYKLDAKTFEVLHTTRFPDEKAFAETLYHDVYHHSGLLYFAPYNASAIAVYDVAKGTFRRIELPEVNGLNAPQTRPEKFATIIEARGKLYFIPAFFPGMLELNPKTHEIKLIDTWLKLLEKAGKPTMRYMRYGVADEERGCLILASQRVAAAIEINLDTHKAVLRNLGDAKASYFAIALYDGAYWISEADRPRLTRLDPVSGETAAYEARLDGLPEEKTFMLQGLRQYGDNIYLLPLRTEALLKFSLKDKAFSIVNEFYTPDNSAFRAMRSGSTGEWFVQTVDGELRAFSPENGLRSGFAALSPTHLEAFLDSLAEVAPSLGKQGQNVGGIANADGSAGKKIYEHCKMEALRP